MNRLRVNKCMLGFIVGALGSVSLAAQRGTADPTQATMLPNAPSHTLMAWSSSALQDPSQRASPAQQAAPPPPSADSSSSDPQQAVPAATAPPDGAQPSVPTASPQQTAPSPASSNPPPQAVPETQEQRRARAEEELKKEESQRMLGVIPNFNTVLGGTAEPLTSRQKFHLFFKSSVDPFQFVAAGLDAGVEQAENSYPEYGQGAEGFGKRYGAAFADSFDGNFWGNAVLPSVLHQDPRYFRLGHGSFKHRLFYSVATVVRTKGDNGRWQPNYSNIAGNFIGGAISNAYYPASDRGVGLTLERGLTVTAEGTIGSLLVEFYPDVINHYKNRRLSRQAAADGTTATPKP